MEARIGEAWDAVRAYWDAQRADSSEEVENPQGRFAREFFEYYKEHPETPTALRAAQTAFMMWGNIGAADAAVAAVPFIEPDSPLWARIINGLGNAHWRVDRGDEFIALMRGLEDTVTEPKGRSEILLQIAGHFMHGGKSDSATTYFERVVSLNAHPFDVQKAESAIYEMNSLQLGDPAPVFTAQTLRGEAISLEELRGKVVLLEFWATSCGPCIPEIPRLRQLHEEIPEADLQVIGISQDEDLSYLAEFLEERGMQWPQIQQLSNFNEDQVLVQDPILELYSVYGIPRSFVIDRDGRIAAKDLRGEELVAAVKKLVADG